MGGGTLSAIMLDGNDQTVPWPQVQRTRAHQIGCRLSAQAQPWAKLRLTV
jgi:hypothetical protein